MESKLVEFNVNRFNIISYNSAAVFYHRSHIQDFLLKWPTPNRLLQVVSKDIVEPVYLAGIRALGILALNPHLQQMQKCFEQWSQGPVSQKS